MIKKLHKIPSINKPIRVLLKSLMRTDSKLISYFASRWTVNGEVSINFDDVKFNFYSNCDDQIVDFLFYNSGNYEETKELNLFGRLAERSKLIFDIGANTGIYSVLAAVKNPMCEIWAFEPYESNFNRLQFNLSLNDIKNVKSFFQAVGNKATKIHVSVPDSGQICDSVSANPEFSDLFYRETVNYKEVEVEQIKLDDLSVGKKIDLIKIDVESYELPVFEGAKNLLERSNAVIQCEIFVDEKRTQFYQEFLKPLGYYCYPMVKDGLAFSEDLKPNNEGRDFLFTKRKLSTDFVSFEDETLVKQLIP